MSGRSIHAVPLSDDAALAAWNAVLAHGESHGRERYATPWALPEMLERLRGPEHGMVYEAWALTEDDVVRASALVEYRTTDNVERIDATVVVDPDHRGRGLGSALLDAMVERTRALGRTRLGADAWWPMEAGTDGVGTLGADFLRARGFALGSSEILRVLTLPTPDAVLDRLAADAATHHADYRIVAFVGPVPDGFAAGWATLAGSLEAEAPTGGIEIEAADHGVEGLRTEEALMVRQGRTPHRAVAVDAAGDVVAYTELVTTAHEPERAYQWGTLVRADHRGHRLGMAVKVAAQRLLQQHAPGVREVFTWNAEENGPMIAVNEALGFRAVERAGWFERRLD
ncbi:hypothetical protein GCM10022215_04920 [Nocardioides fonticola]|uniref:N-acetyltransferase domain-containing protein n=1 Tax=Nocardioides fonticola TaxID=450363 RepID=A0ABP7XBF5_9ACTN